MVILPEYIEVQFGWAVQQKYPTGSERTFTVTTNIDGSTPYRVLLVNMGQLEVHIGEHHWQLDSGSVLFLPPNVRLESMTHYMIKDCLVTAVGFRLLLFGNISIASLLQETTVWQPDDTRFHALTVFADTLLSVQALTSIPRDCILNGTTTAMVGLCWEALSLESVLNKLHPRMPSWLYLVMENIRHSPGMNVNELAERSGYSHSQFHRLFQQYVGVAPRVYLQQYRLDLAKRLLSTTEMQITEIAVHLGFTSASDFTRFFRRMSLETPSEYRASTTRMGMDVIP